MTDAYICDAIRTPIGRFAGSLSSVRADDPAAVPIRSLLERNSTVDWSYRNGIIFRAFGDNILGFAPALCYTAADFDVLFERLERTLDTVLDQVAVRAAVA